MKAAVDMESLSKMLHSIDGQSYGAYRKIKGEYLSTKPSIRLSIEYVQGDPFASPSRISVFIPAQTTHLDSSLFASLLSRRTTADFCLRLFSDIVQGYSHRSGSGKSGQIFVDEPSQEILSRSAASLDSDGCLKLGFYIGLPARGRRILGFQAQKLLVQTLPRLIQAFVGTLDQSWADLKEHVRVQQLQHILRSQLKPNGLVAFVRDGSVLVRQSGHSDLPLDREDAVPWRGPPAMQVRLKGIHGEDIIGTGIPKGVTLICGGGYHGKSTLLQAIARGIYDHVPGDGRDGVVSLFDTVTVRAEEGRSISHVDISPFINHLPLQKNTHTFSTSNASGSTSQAAGLIEAIGLHASPILIDEDSSASNFLIRDRRMQTLVPSEKEPITPLIDRMRTLVIEQDLSFILVMGGSGDYFDVADTVMVMERYQPMDATQRAHEIALTFPTQRIVEYPGSFPPILPRVPIPKSLNPSRGKRESSVRAKLKGQLDFGSESIDLRFLEVLSNISQTRCIGDAILWLLRNHILDGAVSLAELMNSIDAILEEQGPGAFGNEANRTSVRGIDVARVMNRMRMANFKFLSAD